MTLKVFLPPEREGTKRAKTDKTNSCNNKTKEMKVIMTKQIKITVRDSIVMTKTDRCKRRYTKVTRETLREP